MATAFTTWTALRTAIKDAMANALAGDPYTAEFGMGRHRFVAKSFDELTGLLEKSYTLEALESSGDRSTRVSFGRPRRYS